MFGKDPDDVRVRRLEAQIERDEEHIRSTLHLSDGQIDEIIRERRRTGWYQTGALINPDPDPEY